MASNEARPRRLEALQDERGLFKILALDHGSSLLAALERAIKRSVSLDNREVVAIKRAILETLQNRVTGVILDPEPAYRSLATSLRDDIAVLLKLEGGWKPGGIDGQERLTSLLSDWPLDRIAETKAVGIKLMVYYRPDGSPDILQSQRRLAEAVGEACAAHGLIYALEPSGYAMFSDEQGGTPSAEANLASRRPMVVAESVREFGQPKYRADLLKIDFPADLRYVTEFASGGFDGERRDALYDLVTIANVCETITSLSACPWTIMSSGASTREFAQSLRLAVEAGCRGYMCGQGIWSDALAFFPDFEAMLTHLASSGVRNLDKINDALHASGQAAP